MNMNMIMNIYLFSIFSNMLALYGNIFIRMLIIFSPVICSLLLNVYSDIISDYILMNDGQNNQTNINQGGANTGNTGQSPGGPVQGPYGWVHYQHEGDGDDDINNLMHTKLIDHRLECTKSAPYDTRMGDKFNSQEHEYVCDKVMKYAEEHPNTNYRHFVKGNIPERQYTGRISAAFVNAVFPKKDKVFYL